MIFLFFHDNLNHPLLNSQGCDAKRWYLYTGLLPCKALQPTFSQCGFEHPQEAGHQNLFYRKFSWKLTAWRLMGLRKSNRLLYTNSILGENKFFMVFQFFQLYLFIWIFYIFGFICAVWESPHSAEQQSPWGSVPDFHVLAQKCASLSVTVICHLGQLPSPLNRMHYQTSVWKPSLSWAKVPLGVCARFSSFCYDIFVFSW